MPRTATETALLAAVAATPDDDLPRLVYADWCDENGQPDRAEFIRTEVAMLELTLDPDELPDDEKDLPRFNALKQRAAELWVALRRSWFPTVDTMAEACDTERGFPFRLRTSADIFLSHAEQLFREAPTVFDVTLRRVGSRAEALAACEHLARVRWLAFQNPAFRPEQAREFFLSPHLHRLECLTLPGGRNTWFGPEGAMAVADCPSLSNLFILRLNGQHIENIGAGRLFRRQEFAALQRLELSLNSLSDPTAVALAAAGHMGELHQLGLADNSLTAGGVAALTAAPHLSRLYELELDLNPLGPTAAVSLRDAVFAGSLRALSLIGSRIEAEGVETLLTARTFTSLGSLNLSQNWIGPAAARMLDSNDALGSLGSLDLSRCGMTADVAVTLGRVSSLPELENFSAGGQPLGPAGVRGLAGGLLLRPVQALWLEGVEGGDDGLKALAAADLPNLEKLFFGVNGVTDAGAKALAGTRSLPHLRLIDLRENRLTAKGEAVLKERFGEQCLI